MRFCFEIDMKNWLQRFATPMPLPSLMLLCIPMTALGGRPCGAPLFPARNCAVITKIGLQGRSFQAATDLPDALRLNHSRNIDTIHHLFDLQGSLLSEIPVSKQVRRISIPQSTIGNVLTLNLTGSSQAISILLSNRHR